MMEGIFNETKTMGGLQSWRYANSPLNLNLAGCIDHSEDMHDKNEHHSTKCNVYIKQEKEVEDEEIDKSLVLHFASMELTELPSTAYSETARELYLDYNDISELPLKLFCTLTNLIKLSVIGNDLEVLPDEWHHMVNLQELYLNENLLKCFPQSITKLSNLHTFSIVGNQIEYLPDTFGNLSELEKFLADENRLLKLPDSFGMLKDLKVIELSMNNLTKLPDSFGNLMKLQVLNVNGNKLSYLPESFSNLPSLRELDLSENNLKYLPCRLNSAYLITKFYADANLLSDLPSWIGNLPEIVEFSIKDNKLHDGPLPESFGTVSQKLRNLDLGGNFMLQLPETLGCLSSLEYIHIGSILDEVARGNFQNGNWLYQLPRNFGQLTLLREAHLDENQLAQLPESFGDLVNLEWLDLGQNLLDKLPESFCQLSKLHTCYLSKNELTSLPEDIGQLISLLDFRLDNNRLSKLPDTMKNLKALKYLDLFNNMLTEIPDCLSQLPSLESLDLDENKIGMPLDEIPHSVFTSKCPSHDMTKEVWKAHCHRDVLNGLDEGQVEQKENNVSGDDEPNKKVHLSSNLHPWKGHPSSKPKRPIFVRNTSAPLHEQFASFDDEDGKEESEEEENWATNQGPKSWETSFNLTHSGVEPMDEVPSAASHVLLQEQSTEDWDAELEANENPYEVSINYAPGNEPRSPLESVDLDHLFVPSVIHVQRHARTRDLVATINGQFDDADD